MKLLSFKQVKQISGGITTLAMVSNHQGSAAHELKTMVELLKKHGVDFKIDSLDIV